MLKNRFCEFRGAMKCSLVLGFVFSLLSAAGCATNKSFDFPQEGERVVIRVKAQQDLALRPMKAIYRSSICNFTNYTASWTPYERDGYNSIVKLGEPESEKGLYRAEFDIDGGGKCQWKLSNVTFGVRYKHPEKFGGDFQRTGAGGVTVVFDDNSAQRSAVYTTVPGDLEIKENYYLWVAERLVVNSRVNVGLLAEEGLFLSYRAKEARSIYFEPHLYADYITYSSMSKAKGKGYDVTFTYPDGSVIKDGRVRPDFRKLQCIRLPSACKK